MMHERIRCPSGPDGRCDLQSIGEFPDRSGCLGKVEVLRCRHCGIGISAPPISDAAFLYADRSSQDFQPSTRGLAHFIKKVVFHRQARELLAMLPDRPRRVVDFGCGSGLFTRCLADELADGEVIGVDFHREAPHDLAGRPYRSISETDDIMGTADVVLAMHVLEHDDDVARLLGRITALARPRGQIVIEVPNIDCVWAKVFGGSWDGWYLPFHRTHFNKTSLEALLAANELAIEAVFDICVPTMGRTAANMFRRRNNFLFLLLGILLHPIQWSGEFISGRPSAFRVIARLGDRRSVQLS